MPFAPGQSGNPKGYSGPRNRRRHEVFEIIKNLGHKDALETLSYLQHNEQIDPGLRIAAASALAPFCHPKLQATPTPRYIEHSFEVPQFETIQEAERILARIPVLTANGQLDFQSALELTTMIKTWIDAKTASELEERLTIVEKANGITHSFVASERGIIL